MQTIRCARLAVVLASVSVAAGCRSKPKPVTVLNPQFFELVPCSSNAGPGAFRAVAPDGTGWFCDRRSSIDMSSVDLARVRVVDGSLFVPMTVEGQLRLLEWSRAHVGESIGVFIDCRLVQIFELKSEISYSVLLPGQAFAPEQTAQAMRSGGRACTSMPETSTAPVE